MPKCKGICKAHQVCNPGTGKCVSRTGAGQDIIPEHRLRPLDEAGRLLRKFRKLPANQQKRQAERMMALKRHLDNTVYERRTRINQKTGDIPLSGDREYLQKGRGILFPVGRKPNGTLIWKTEDVDFLADWFKRSRTNPWTRETVGQPTLPKSVYRAVIRKYYAASRPSGDVAIFDRSEFERDILRMVRWYSDREGARDPIFSSEPSWTSVDRNGASWSMVKHYRTHPSSTHFSNTTNIVSAVFLTYEYGKIQLEIYTGDVIPGYDRSKYQRLDRNNHLQYMNGPPRQWTTKYIWEDWVTDRGLRWVLRQVSALRDRTLQGPAERIARKIVGHVYSPKGKPTTLVST